MLPSGSHRVICSTEGPELSLCVQHAHQSSSSAHQLWHKRSHPSSGCDLSECPHRLGAFIISEGNGRLPAPHLRVTQWGYLKNRNGEVKTTLVQPNKNRKDQYGFTVVNGVPEESLETNSNARLDVPGLVQVCLAVALGSGTDVGLSGCGCTFRPRGRYRPLGLWIYIQSWCWPLVPWLWL